MNIKNSRALRILIMWTTFHLMAFALAGTKINFFNSESSVNQNNIWPFVSIIELPKTERRVVSDASGRISGIKSVQVGTKLNGIFYSYGSRELFIYLILGFASFAIYYLVINEKKEIQSE